MFAVSLDPIPRHYREQDLDSYGAFVQLKNEASWSEVKLRSDIYKKGVHESHFGPFFKSCRQIAF